MEDSQLENSVDLIHAAQRGDANALDRLFSRYYERVRRVVRARMGRRVRSVMESGDVLQNTFMTAVKVFDRFEIRTEASLIQWLAQIAERQIRDAADWAKAKKRDHDRLARLDSSPDVHPAAEGGTPLDELAAADHEELLMRAIDGLPEEHRELVVERHFVGGSWDEVAARVDKPSAAAARMAYGTAKAKLARRLLELGVEDSDAFLPRG